MASHSHADLSNELTQMRPGGRRLGVILMAAGLALVLVAALASIGSEHGAGRRFWFAYLFGLAAVTAISCASLITMLIQHLVRSGWITNVRRILETMAVQVVLVGVLALPFVGMTLLRHGTVYSWAVPSDTPVVEHDEGGHEGGHGEHAEKAAERGADGHATATPAVENAEDAHAHTTPADVAHSSTAPSVGQDAQSRAGHVGETQTHEPQAVTYPNEQVMPGVDRPFNEKIARKAHGWLNPWFWALRIVVYFASLGLIAYSYWSTSVRQDATGDLDLSDRMFGFSGPLLIVAGFFTTFIAFDLFMSLDAEWFSTMFGVYFFASGTQAMWATIALFVIVLQSRGYITQSVTQEHRHDIGKFLWAFIFFFAYIAFDQYMLQWYANLPEETFWYDKRGYSTANPNGYSPLVLALVLGRWLIPFAGLLSRHVKRNKFGLGFWAAWLLCFFFIDMYLIVIPESHYAKSVPLFGLPELCAFLGIAGLWLGNVIRVLGNHALRPVRDPRVHESLALQNF